MAQLPPRVPNMAAIWPQFSPQKKIIMSPMDDPSWADEFLDFSTKRGSHSHRRSMSDSVAFLDIPLMAVEEEECRRRSSIIPGSSNGGLFEKFDDDERGISLNTTFEQQQQQQQQQQLMMSSSMFNRDDNMIMGSGGGGGGGPNSSNPSSPSDFNNMNIDDEDDDEKEVPSDQHLRMQQLMMMKNEPEEDESSCKSDQGLFQAHAHNGIMDNNNNSGDKIMDPKRIKRILANRQSAQRSRVRKLQYVSELERSVTSLQAEISVLSPRVAYLDHQRLILGVDNGVLKQRIAALAQDKIFKDAHQEALKREIERLRQVYNYQQNLNSKKDNEPHINSQTSPAAVNGYAEKEQLVN